MRMDVENMSNSSEGQARGLGSGGKGAENRPPKAGLSRGRHIRQAFCTRRHFRLHAAENGMTSPHTNLYENASKASHCRRRHLVVAAAL